VNRVKYAYSKIDTRGRVSVPATVSRTLNVGPGDSLLWQQHPEGFLVRRLRRTSSIEIHDVLSRGAYLKKLGRRKALDVKAATATHIRKRHAVK